MANPVYLASDLGLDAAVSVSTEDAAYPKANLQDRVLAKVFRGTSASALNIELDFGASVQLDTWMLGNHNIDSGATVLVKSGASSPPSTTTHTFTWRALDMVGRFTPTSARYWAVDISGAAAGAPLQIGWMPVGAGVALPRTFRYGVQPAREEHRIGHETNAGVRWRFRLFGRDRFRYPFRFPDEELAAFRALHDAVDGDRLPFVWIPDQDLADVYVVRKDQDFEPTEIANQAGRFNSTVQAIYDYMLTVTSESRGLEVAA